MGLVGGRDQPWRRWWANAGDEPRLYNGVLADPLGPHGKYLAPGLTELSDHDDTRCLVLLGEPGSGKTHELEADRDRWAANGALVLAVDLGAYLTAPELRDAVMADPMIEAWRAGTDELVLFLDGFDEAHEATLRVAEVLSACFRKLPADRLRIRITSRSSIWPERLTTQLDSIWPGSQRTLTLAPLTQSDIELAAAGRQGGGERFMIEVLERDIAPIAARPVTLGMLLALGNEALPDDRVDLYRRATAHLASESNQRRQQDRKQGPGVQARSAAARLMATASIVTGTPLFEWRSQPQTGNSIIGLDSLDGDSVAQDHLDAVWDSALLTSAGSGARRWIHRSVAEFLAASRLASLPTPAVRHLLADPETGKVIPQLSGTAVWCSYLKDEVWDWLAGSEPELLVTADLRTAPIERRQAIAQSLISAIKSGPPSSGRSNYRHLGYPGIEDDLRPLLDSSEPVWVRREALMFCRQADVTELDDEIVGLIEQVVSSISPDVHSLEVDLATLAPLGLGSVRDPGIRDRLKALAASPTAPLRIRGAVAELLAAEVGLVDTLRLLEPDPFNYSHRDLHRDIEGLVETALGSTGEPWAEALTWLDSQPASSRNESTFQKVVGSLIHYGLTDSPADAPWTTVGVLTAEATLAGNGLFDWRREDMEALSPDLRRQLAQVTMKAEQAGWYSAHTLRTFGVIADHDFEHWVRTYATALEAGDVELASAANEVLGVFGGPTAERTAIADQMLQAHPMLDPWHAAFTSPAARAGLERSIEAEAARQMEQAAADAGRYFNARRLDQAIDAREWDAAATELGHNTDASRGHVWGTPFSTGPAWRSLDDPTRSRVLALALAFLIDPPAQTDRAAEDFGEAFSLVNHVDPVALDQIPSTTWLDWLPSVIEATHVHEGASSMIERAARSNPLEVERIVVARIQTDAPKQHAGITSRIGNYTTPAVEDALTHAIEHNCRDPHVLTEYLGLLLKRSGQRAISICLQFLDDRLPSRPHQDDPRGPAGWDRAVAALVTLMHAPALADHFDEVLGVCRESPNLAARAIRTSTSRPTGKPWAALDEGQLESLHLWARECLPEPGHMVPGRGYSSDPVTEFSSAVFRMLSERVTPASMAALERIAQTTGEPWGLTAANDLAAKLRDDRWIPPTLSGLLAVLKDPRRRDVRNEAQLAAVLLDAIDTVRDEIRSDADVRSIFWNKQLTAPVSYVPVDEKHFATRFKDRLERHLDEVILRQECQLSLSLGETKGSLLDLEAIVKITGGPEVVVIVEAKGNWHADVLTAMKDQLVDRYLTGKRSRTGIFLVAAFASPEWASTDWRERSARTRTAEALTPALDHQAADLSVGQTTVYSRVVDLTL